MSHDTSFLSTEKLSIQSRPHIILARSISRLNEILFHYFEVFQNQIILFTLILKVITSIGNETIFHLIVKSTLPKLCGVV
jgi:hypothetical protein